MERFSLQSFLKICEATTAQRRTAIDRKLSLDAGYDFYRTLSRAIRLFADGASTDDIEFVLESPNNAVERDRNRSAFLNFKERYGKLTSLQQIKLPKSCVFKEHEIEISCDPLFQTVESGVPHLHSIWAIANPQLTLTYGAVGCHIMRLAYKSSTMSNSRMCIANLSTSQRFSEKQITNSTPSILQTDLKIVSDLIREAR
jgi:hypothetical protein